MALPPALSSAVHDLQARLGSIRIAVTAVAGLDLDEETRREMLTSASEESVRASAELAAISALTACVLDDSSPAACDVVAALREAAELVRLSGIDVQVADGSLDAVARAASLTVALPALMRVTAGAGKQLLVSISDATVTVARGGSGDTESMPAVRDSLLRAIGAEPVDEFAFRFAENAP